jgi:hypothetical protein
LATAVGMLVDGFGAGPLTKGMDVPHEPSAPACTHTEMAFDRTASARIAFNVTVPVWAMDTVAFPLESVVGLAGIGVVTPARSSPIDAPEIGSPF